MLLKEPISGSQLRNFNGLASAVLNASSGGCEISGSVFPNHTADDINPA